MNVRLMRLSIVLALALAVLLTVSMAGMALENSMLEVPLAPVTQAQPTATPTAQQGSRYSQYLRQKKARTPEAADPTPVSVDTPTGAPAITPVTTPVADDASASVASAPVRAIAVVGGNRLQRVIGDRLSSTLYGLGDDDSLFRSEDDGGNWEVVTDSSEIKDFTMSPADALVLYSGSGLECDAADAGTETTIAEAFYRSGDGGVSWERLTLGDNLVPLLADPQDAERLLAADCELPYLSANGGDSWQSKLDRSSVALWDKYHVDEIAVASLVGAPSVESANLNYLYASGTDEDGTGVVAYSGDTGETWERITPRISPQPRGISSLTADPTTAGRLWFADRNGVWYTDDFGASWQLTILGLGDVLNAGDKLDVTGLTDILYLPNDDIYLATIEGLYRGKPGSGIWTLVEDGEFGAQRIESLLVTESQPEILWVNAEDGVYLYPVK
jgi:hypothetical protein